MASDARGVDGSPHKRTFAKLESSVSELDALPQDSRASLESLGNTGAGIHCLGTFARMAKIRVMPLCGGADHMELVFDDDRLGSAVDSSKA